MEENIYIYGLKIKGQDEFRYIGRTNNIKRRLAQHINQVKGNSYKVNWIKKNIKIGNEILLEIIEIVDNLNWVEKEIFYINKYKNLGHRLTNILSGGEYFYENKIYCISYDEAKKIIQKLEIKTTLEFRNKSKQKEIPINVPKRPDLYFKGKGWISWSDFLNKNIISNKNKTFLEYEKAINFVKKLDINSNSEWIKYCSTENKPSNIPSNPDVFYKNNGWISWYEWLSHDNSWRSKKQEFLSYNDSKIFIKFMGLKTHRDWVKYSKNNRPVNIPANPWKIYKEWIGIKDWLSIN